MMAETIESHETIADAFAPAKQVLARLLPSAEAARAARHLGISEQYAHEAYEKVERSDRGLG